MTHFALFEDTSTLSELCPLITAAAPAPSTYLPVPSKTSPLTTVQEPKVIPINSLCTVIELESDHFFARSKPRAYRAEVFTRPHNDQFGS
jgi:hypothetical protein